MEKEEGTRKPKGDSKFSAEIPTRKPLLGHKLSGLGEEPSIARQSNAQPPVLESQKVKVENVMERVYDLGRLYQAWHQVKQNAGSAGIDKMTVEEFEGRRDELLSSIHERLKAGTYRFKPAKRVEIPKPGSSKTRPLGIPIVMDRVVSQSMNLALEEIFESKFTHSNFGFRRGKSQHQAIESVRQSVAEGFKWCSAIDLENFFGEISHGIILKLIRRNIRDERLVTLIARALKAGVIIDGEFHKTEKGVPQGSPVSPILSNIVLNELDHELERRGHRYCRWADDFIILVKSERAANRISESVTLFLKEKLGLIVNKEKSQITRVSNVEFVGFEIFRNKIRIGTRARTKFKQRVKELTKRNNPLSTYTVIQELNEYLRGWVGYFKVQQYRMIFRDLDAWIRSRLRSMQLKKWKNPRKFQKILIASGFFANKARKVWIRMKSWRSVLRPEVRFVLSNDWFRRRGLISLDYFTERNLELPLGR
jgi:RNA-directed DNA polymerase